MQVFPDNSHLPQLNASLNKKCIKTIDMHTAGEPLRIITEGLPEIKGNSVLECRNFFKNNLDHLRTTLMWEPRGHTDMYGCVILPPFNKESDFGVFFLHNEGYSTMCGHAIIALTRFAVDTGLVNKQAQETKVIIDTPAGKVTSYATLENEQEVKVRFLNVPSFASAVDQKVEVPGIGNIKYDVAFGGAYYAFVDSEQFNLALVPSNTGKFIDLGMKIKKEVMRYPEFTTHPKEDDLGFLYGVIFTGPSKDATAFSRNICVFAEGEVDRSPTGTGVSARMALHYLRGDIELNQSCKIESIIDTVFTGKVVNETFFGSYPAVIPEISGSAYYTGSHEFWLEEGDEMKDGFLLR